MDQVDARGGRPSVLVVVGTFPVRSETFVLDHIRLMLAAGWGVTTAAWRVDRSLLPQVEGQLGPIVDLRALRRPATRRELTTMLVRRPSLLGSTEMRLAAARSLPLRLAIERVEPDLVHAHFGPAGIAAAFASSGVPLIVDFHGYDVTSLPRRAGWQIYRPIRRATAVAHSDFTETLIRRNLESTTVARVRYGVDLDVFRRRSDMTSWPRTLRLLTVGRLVRDKGIDLAVDTVARLLDDGVDCHLRIVGAGEEADPLRRRAHERGITDRVTLMGPLDPSDVARVMCDSDVRLIPSRASDTGWEEAFCKVAVEGMATGLAVIASRSGGLPQTVGDGGFLVPRNEPGCYADRIKDVVRTRSPVDIAVKARGRAVAFSLDAMRADYVAVSSSVLATASRNGPPASAPEPDHPA